MPHRSRACHRTAGLVAVILIAALVLAAAATRASSPIPQDGAAVALEGPAAAGLDG